MTDDRFVAEYLYHDFDRLALARIDAAQPPHKLLYDGHGSTRALLDAAAAFVQHYVFTAYEIQVDRHETILRSWAV